MPALPLKTRFTNSTRLQALIILAITFLALALCLWGALAPKPASTAPEADGGDLRVYRRIIERIHSGEGYYDAAGSELRAGGYPTAALFNWRTPTYAWVLGTFPSPAWGQVLLVVLALAMMFLALVPLRREAGAGMMLAGLLLLWGACHWCIDGDAFLSQELWAAILIALSICAYAHGRWPLGVAAGLGALFFRELALPYVLLGFGIACWQRRWKEAAVLFVGLALYSLFLLFHFTQVSRHISSADRAPASWIQFGGIGFVLQTCRMNAFLFSPPLWVSAIYLPLSMLGLAAIRGETGLRLGLTAGLYIAAFAVVGQPFNDYWGLLYAPLLPFGFACAPAALRDLASALLHRRSEDAKTARG
jgi:hypothetical protein